MSATRIAFLACLAGAGLAGVTDLPAAPHGRHGGTSLSSPAPRHAFPAHRGVGPTRGHRPWVGSHWRGGHRGHSDWAWGLGLAIGLPWVLGWHDPWWGPAYYPPRYAYGYLDAPYGGACGYDEDCLREREALREPTPPTTEVAPAAPGSEEGGPTQRPLHLNYCDSARAWFPHVRTCPGGWRLVLPDYGPAR
ncbi:MAG: hypothetical protein AB7P08_14775 [Burkholderiales bacterium]